MAPHSNHHEVKIIEECQVAPPQGSSLPQTTIIHLSFFDTIFYGCPTVKRIFFYEFPYPTNHFIESAIPTLKHSLSLTLQHFFPFSSHLIVPPQPQAPFIRYQHGDSLSFIVAESKADFSYLVSDSPQDVTDWHPFVPPLPQQVTLEDGTCVFPLMAIQLTVLPNAGFAICLSFNHLAADGKSLHHFIKFWATLCNGIMNKRSEVSDDGFSSLITEGSLSLPLLDRDIVKETNGVNKHVYLKNMRDLTSEINGVQGRPVQHVPTDKVLAATLVLSRDQVEKLKKLVCLKYYENNNHGSDGTLLHLSTFVVTCSLIWVCMIQSEEQSKSGNNDELCYFGFLADCRGYPEFLVPSTYFGNCLLWVIVALKRVN